MAKSEGQIPQKMTVRALKEGRPSALRSSSDDATEQLYNLERSLLGRGQPGLAAFYRGDKDGRLLLIKEDDPATCVLEGSAHFISEFLPSAHQRCVNCARAGVLHQGDKKSAISMQPALSGFVPLDTLVYGRKRKPKTLWSDESTHVREINQTLGRLSGKAKCDLAAAVFASTAVGDESLHIGQFMAKQDERGDITDISRIDFGARERFGLARREAQDFHHKTSGFYQKSGQFGKDYISYLLADPKVRASYLQLWMRADPEKMAIEAQKALVDQLTLLPPDLQEKALSGVLSVINKGAKKPVEIPKDLPVSDRALWLGNTLMQITRVRSALMQKEAWEIVNTELNQSVKVLAKILPKQHDDIERLRDEMLDVSAKEGFASSAKRLIEINHSVKQLTKPEELLSAVRAFNALLIQAEARLEWKLPRSSEEMAQEKTERMQAIKQLQSRSVLLEALISLDVQLGRSGKPRTEQPRFALRVAIHQCRRDDDVPEIATEALRDSLSGVILHERDLPDRSMEDLVDFALKQWQESVDLHEPVPERPAIDEASIHKPGSVCTDRDEPTPGILPTEEESDDDRSISPRP